MAASSLCRKLGTKYCLTVPLIFTLFGHARADDWSTTDKVLGGISAAALLSDWRQTQKIAISCNSGGGYWEMNPILGHCPSVAKVNMYFATVGVTGYFISDALPSKWRKRVLIGVGVVETAWVHHNNSLGLFVFTSELF